MSYKKLSKFLNKYICKKKDQINLDMYENKILIIDFLMRWINEDDMYLKVKVFTLKKKEEIHSYLDLRTIAITSAQLKLIEAVIYDDIEFNVQNLIKTYKIVQFGFLKERQFLIYLD